MKASRQVAVHAPDMVHMLDKVEGFESSSPRMVLGKVPGS